jgi:hypothetical protein
MASFWVASTRLLIGRRAAGRRRGVGDLLAVPRPPCEANTYPSSTACRADDRRTRLGREAPKTKSSAMVVDAEAQMANHRAYCLSRQ